MVFLIKAVQLILCFCILIVMHEMGHFFFAKLFKIRVSKFCLFFDPWVKPLKLFKWHGTDFCIGWLPLGGYVNIEGMVDESKKASDLSAEVQPWEFRAKPSWQRLLVMVGGVLVNFILALVIYAMVMFTWGETYVPVENMTHGMAFNEQAEKLGFRDGDILIATDYGKLREFDSNESITDAYRAVSTSKTATVLRDGQSVTINLPGKLNLLEMMKATPPFMLARIPTVVDSVMVKGPAATAGMMAGDTIMCVNGKAVDSWSDITAFLKDDALALATVPVVVKRAGALDTLTVTLAEDKTMGVVYHHPITEYATDSVSYGFLESFPAGTERGWRVLKGYVGDLKYLFTKEGAQSIGSFGTIGSLFPASWDWMRFWEMTAFISLMLAFMNFLPIPALDGGYIFMTLIEIVTRRKLSEKFVEKANTIGMYLLFALMAYAIINDFIRLT